MEILFVTHKYPPATGGMEKQSMELITGIRQYATVHTIIYDNKGGRLSFFLGLRQRILNACKNHPGISVIHFNDGLAGAVCLWHKGYNHLKRTVTFHGLDIVFPNKLFRRFVLPRFNLFDLIFAVSQATANVAINLGIAAEKIVVVNNGVDTALADGKGSNRFTEVMDKYQLNVQEKHILVAMGRPVKRKGFSWFIENVIPKLQGEFMLLLIGPFKSKPSAFEIALRFMPGFLRRQIELVSGYPTDEKVIRKLLVDPAFEPRIKHLGRLPFDEIVTILQHASAFVMPNIHVEGDMEGFGLVCLEACLCGAPVYAANIDGIPDAIQHNKNGFLIEPGNAGQWAEILNKVLACSHFGLKQRPEYINYTKENFGWDKMVRTYLQHFNDLAG